MEEKDISILIKILRHQKRSDLADLFEGSKGEVEQSGQFGNHWNSVISTFLIFSPIEQYFRLKEVSTDDKEFIHKCILDIYPLADGEPEIVGEEYRMLREESEGKASASFHVGRTNRVFISYSSEDKIFAGKIKQGLEEYGLEVFLAHEDIDPATEWQITILENLESTDIFMPILTDKFHASFWTDQESGIAFTKNKLIVPISINGHNPYGFLAKYQALKLNNDPQLADCGLIVKSIIKARPQFETQILDSLIKAFTGSSSWTDAGKKAWLIFGFENINNEQINEIFKAGLQNNEISASFTAKGRLQALFRKYQNKIDPKIKKDLIAQNIIYPIQTEEESL